MNIVQPIRDSIMIEQVKRYLLTSSPQYGERNRMLFVFGINVGLRIQDILKLRVRDVKGEHIIMREMKTDKQKWLIINPTLRKELNRYTSGMDDFDFLFQSREGKNKPISRDMAYKILKKAANELELVDIGTHTMRKTFGYHFYQKTKDIVLLQKIFNHSSPDVTMRYIGMDQDMMDKAIGGFGL
ncbi:site-specific integrase [Paenibacillus thiaminolyticus]|uniref:site-specific integrase n=1 Tax=Paenibacillus thiaminolyticus TaxID=49283 RepID=UPI00234FDA77|nr:site-specific integrase [Paenibacillus thiaminolyticus]WCR29729.1 site-specific integrase [Paenibacillus thiaminolyticus]